MPSLTMCVGLPGSGKSTWAIEQVAKDPNNTVRVNRDSLRSMQNPVKWPPKFEKSVRIMRDTLIRSLLTQGKNVINDDTNLTPKHEADMKKIAADHQAEFRLNNSFMDVSVEECIARDVQRKDGHVGKDVIERMYYDYWSHQPKPTAPVRPPYPAIMVDLDGTYCRLPKGMQYPAAFDRDYRLDTCDMAVDVTVNALREYGHSIVILSGRFSERKDQTEEWLTSYGIEYDALLMRPVDDRRPDTIVKKELFIQHVLPHYRVTFVLDDRPSVCRMWRAECGLNVFQVAPNMEF